MKPFNIHLSGVGGQGIGLLSEVILRAADHAGLNVKAVDTHGLAQRGGIVVSQIRIGDSVYTPLISRRRADLVVSLERHEALRALVEFARDGGTLVYSNTVWQPLDVRLGRHGEVTEAAVAEACMRLNVRLIDVFEPQIEEARMQNVALLARISSHALVPGVDTGHYLAAMEDLMDGKMLEKNRRLFQSLCPAAVQNA
jgi:indolepyruvate ferredoxin oxidoreductase beta subunit